jgi:uncharacterized protein (TIGR00290 family)
MKKNNSKTMVCWGSGKDSAWALHLLRQRPDICIHGLLTTVNEVHQRVAMHAVRVELLKRQADAVGLPLRIVNIPDPCTNEDYERVMGNTVEDLRREDVEYLAFGDIFLQDIREYRETKLSNTGIRPLFPLWAMETAQLSREMISNGLRAVVTCVDPRFLPSSFAGREIDESFLADLPSGVDPCGERGEFHSFAFGGPMFRKSLDIDIGDIVERDGFIFADLLPKFNPDIHRAQREGMRGA